MLIEFRVENHRSLKTEQVLTMEAGRVDGDTTIPRTVPGYSKPLLPVAALYGANASGKSNVLSGLAFMRRAVVNSHLGWSQNDRVPREPFAWGENRSLPSMYEALFVVSGTRFHYGFVASDERIEEEWLHAWPKGKQQIWFDRESQTFAFGDNLKGVRHLIRDVTRHNALFLSVGAQHGNEQLRRVYSWFSQVEFLHMKEGASFIQNLMTVSSMILEEHKEETHQEIQSDKSNSVLDEFRSLLALADLGIVDLRFVSTPESDHDQHPSRRLQFKHSNSTDDAWLSLANESKGTKTLFEFGIPLITALRTGSTVIVDELEASLHPKLAIEIIKQFNNPKTNPKNAQLIFTTHDTNLLGNDAGEPVLRRDQVWLTEKDKEGATTLYPLTDYKPRKAENVERGYLQGRYGAIPYLGNFSLLGKEAT